MTSSLAELWSTGRISWAYSAAPQLPVVIPSSTTSVASLTAHQHTRRCLKLVVNDRYWETPYHGWNRPATTWPHGLARSCGTSDTHCCWRMDCCRRPVNMEGARTSLRPNTAVSEWVIWVVNKVKMWLTVMMSLPGCDHVMNQKRD